MLQKHSLAKPGPRRLPAAPSGSCCARQYGNVAAHGILDSYRREKGLLPPAPADAGQQTGVLERTGGALTGLLGLQQQQQQQQPRRQQRHPRQDPCEDGSSSSSSGDDDAPCFVECVHKVRTLDELKAQLDAAGQEALVVVDFYKAACGACKYVAPGFLKLCKATAAKSMEDGAAAPPVVFLKHNVYDEEEEEVTDLAKAYNVRSVPRFIFFKAGLEVDNFATRDKEKVAAAILKHAPAGVELGDWNV